MKFLVDEDVPVAILYFLRFLGHEAERVISRTPDLEIAQRAKRKGMIVLTLDQDFTNMAQFPPKEFNIVRIQIHPPTIPAITEALKDLFAISPRNLKGLIVVRTDGHIQFL